MATPDPDLQVVKIGERQGSGKQAKKGTVGSADRAAGIVARVAKVLRTPGVTRSVIYRSILGKNVYAYYARPTEPHLVVREDEAGRRVRIFEEDQRGTKLTIVRRGER